MATKKRKKKKPAPKSGGALYKKINKIIKTIKSWYIKDENGKYNRVAQVCFGFAYFLPIGILECVKVGIYAKYSYERLPVKIFFTGLLMPFLKVLFMGRTMQSAGFGTKDGTFDAQYLFIFFFFYSMVFAIMYINAEIYKNKSVKSKGVAKFGKISEFNERFSYHDEDGEPIEPPENSYEPGNIITSMNTRYALEPKGTNTYSCVLVAGITGCGKTYTYVKPNILQMNSSFVITDPKGELTSDLGAALMRHGYEVKVFNLNEPQYSCKYNPFHYIREEADVVTAVNVFLENTKASDSNGDPFFELAEKNFYLAIFFYIYTVYKDQPERQTFKEIYEIYQKSNEQDANLKRGETAPINEFDQMFMDLAKEDPANPALPYYATFKKGSMKTKQSILISVGVKLWFLSVGSIANLMSDDSLELEKVGDRKTALFVIIPAEKDTYRFLSAILFTQLFETLYHVGNTLNEKSWFLQKGNCIALRSEPFIAGTASEEQAKADLAAKRDYFSQGYVEDDKDLMKKDPEVKRFFETRSPEGFLPLPRARIVRNKPETGEKEVLMECQSRAQADMFYDAILNGKIVRGKKELTNHVRFMLDEFFNLGKINDFDKKIATFRSLRISCDIIVQSISQLKELYEDRESKITNNCSVQICLGAATMEDCQYFSDMAGSNTVESESKSISRKGIAPGLDGSNLAETDELVIRPEEIRTMAKDKCLIFVNTMDPVWDIKYDSSKHPRWKETYSQHDQEETVCNQFQYRRLFFIKQEDSNRVITVIPEPQAMECSEGGGNNGRKRNVIPGKAPDNGVVTGKGIFDEESGTPVKKAGDPAAELARAVGIDAKPSLESVNENYERHLKRSRDPEAIREAFKEKYKDAVDENGNIPVAHPPLGEALVNSILSGLKDGSMWQSDPVTHVVTPTENNALAKAIKNGKVKKEQVVTSGSISDVIDLWGP